MNKNRVNANKSNRQGENSKLAFLMAGLVVVLSIMAIAMITSIAKESSEVIESKTSSLLSMISKPSKTSIITDIEVLGKENYEDNKIRLLASISQFEEEAYIEVESHIADQLKRNNRYRVVRVEKTDIFSNTEIEYKFIIDNKYSGYDLDTLRTVGVERLEAKILDLRYEDSAVENGGIIQYYVSAELGNTEGKQYFYREISEEKYNSLLESETVEVVKNTYKLKGSNTIIDYTIPFNN